jgi:pimeloyl-ACP methyl ester carboxylesterase
MTTHWVVSENSWPGFRQFVRDWQPPGVGLLPILALHGSLTQSGAWIVPAAMMEDVRMVCPDQRGFGKSDYPGTDSCAAFAADAIAQANGSLPGRFIVMGHSFACSIALEVARTVPDRIAGAILVDPLVPFGKPVPATPPPVWTPIPHGFADLDAAERYYRETEEGEWSAPALRRYLQDILVKDAQGGWRFPYTSQRLRRLREFVASPASDHGLMGKTGGVQCPVLIFRGGRSKRFVEAGEKPFAASFPRPAETIVCPTSGHFPTATEPEIIVAGILRFLRTLS